VTVFRKDSPDLTVDLADLALCGGPITEES